MTNVIAYADDWAAEARAAGEDYKQVRATVQDRATAEHPIYLGMVTGVTYDSKTDRYIAKWDVSSAKVSNDVAEFMLREIYSAKRTARPTVYVHMTDGVIDGALLLFLSRS